MSRSLPSSPTLLSLIAPAASRGPGADTPTGDESFADELGAASETRPEASDASRSTEDSATAQPTSGADSATTEAPVSDHSGDDSNEASSGEALDEAFDDEPAASAETVALLTADLAVAPIADALTLVEAEIVTESSQTLSLNASGGSDTDSSEAGTASTRGAAHPETGAEAVDASAEAATLPNDADRPATQAALETSADGVAAEDTNLAAAGSTREGDRASATTSPAAEPANNGPAESVTAIADPLAEGEAGATEDESDQRAEDTDAEPQTSKPLRAETANAAAEATTQRVESTTGDAARVESSSPTTTPINDQATRTEAAAPSGTSDAAAGPDNGPPPIDPGRFVSRVARAFDLAQQRGGGPIEMRLSPPELGALQVKIEVREGVLTASMETETPAARNALLDNLPALRDRLAEQQIRIEKFDVDVRDDRSSQQGERQSLGDRDRQDDSERPSDRYAASRLSREDEDTVRDRLIAQLAPLAMGSGRIDVTA